MFRNCSFHILSGGDVTKKRSEIFEENIIKNDGIVTTVENATHIVTDKRCAHATLLKINKNVLEGKNIVDFNWLIECLKNKSIQPIEAFLIPCTPKIITPTKRPLESDGMPYESSSKYVKLGDKTDRFVCAHSSVEAQQQKSALKDSDLSVNEHVVDVLNQMISTFENTSDKWRAYGYRKAVVAIKQLQTPIRSKEDVAHLPGVGDRLADKVWEIVTSGHLRKLDELSKSDHMKTLSAFTAVWGAGPQTANAWIQAGYQSIADLRARAPEGFLTKQQTIGLKYYEEFLGRIPRAEVAEIETTVIAAVDTFGEGFVTQACGSYRRGRPDCGDVDILVSHPREKMIHNLLPRLVNYLETSGFITDHLVHLEEDGNQMKYFGVCVLPKEGALHRRLDIVVSPWEELACCRLYFTGSAHFTRSMRALAKSKGMFLDNHHLRENVVRVNGERVNNGVVVPTPTEEAVFERLGIPFREPHERDH